MVQCSRHVIPAALEVGLTNQPAHDLALRLEVQALLVLTGQRLGTTLTPTSEDVEPH
jgi:hypothetical protein